MSTPQEPEQPQPAAPEPAASSPEPKAAAPAPDSTAAPQAAPPYGAPQAASASQQPQQAYQVPNYAPPPGYEQAPGYAVPRANPKTWMNVVSLVTSILGMGLIGVIFGHLGLSAAKRGEAELRGLGIAGLILGYLGIVLSIILTIVVISLVGSCANDPACVDWWTELSESSGS